MYRPDYSRAGRRDVLLAIAGAGISIAECSIVQRTTDTAQSGWWDTAWRQRRRITIDEQNGSDLTEYPVVVSGLDIEDASPESIRVVDHQRGEPVRHGWREVEGLFDVAFWATVEANADTDRYVVYYDNPDANDTSVRFNEARYNVYFDFTETALEEWIAGEGTETDWYEIDHDEGLFKRVTSNGEAGQLRWDLENIHEGFTLDQQSVGVFRQIEWRSRDTGAGKDQFRTRLIERDKGDNNMFQRTYENVSDGIGVNLRWDAPDESKLLTADQFSVGDLIYTEEHYKPDGTVTAYARNVDTDETGSQTYEAPVYDYDSIALWQHGGKAEWSGIRIRYKAESEPDVSVGDSETVSTDTDASIQEYAGEDGTVDTQGVLDAFADWRAGDIGIELLLAVFGAWQSGERVT